ncbi:MAG: hypothetical protein U1F34_05600 [Gammaproteobacteria bacterium]
MNGAMIRLVKHARASLNLGSNLMSKPLPLGEVDKFTMGDVVGLRRIIRSNFVRKTF